MFTVSKKACIFESVNDFKINKTIKMTIEQEKEFKALEKAAEHGTIKDEQNPVFILTMTSNNLLAQIIKGEIDIKALAEYTLQNRGYDLEGKWVGFKSK